MKLHTEFAQGSVEWMLARSSIATASEFDQLVSFGEKTGNWTVREGEMPRTYAAKKLAEKWQGGPLPEFNSFDMDIGTILENEARPWLSLHMEQPIDTIGFITTDCGSAGCSPDGIIHELNLGAEIKCPSAPVHVRYLINGKLPPEYAPQVQGSMYITGFTEWIFLSYRRNFPKLVLRVQRDEKAQEAIREALVRFNAYMEMGYGLLCEKNGGPPRHIANQRKSMWEPNRNDVPTP